MEFTIRGYRQGDEYPITGMFNEIFGVHRDISHWYWKYRDNPQGSPIISVAVTSDGVLAAHYAAYPLKLCFYEAEKDTPLVSTIYHAGDKMTRKQFRSVGFGKSALLSRTYEHFRGTPTEHDTAFKFGFMAHHSLRFGLLFFDYSVIEQVHYRRLPLADLDESRGDLLRRVIRGITTETVSEVDAAWTEFFKKVASHYRCLIKRDASYVTWRYLLRPDRRYLVVSVKKRSTLIGWSVFYREGNRIIWGDALFRPGDLHSVKNVLMHLKRHPIAAGADCIDCWFPSRPHWWDSVLDHIGFVRDREPNNLHFCIGNIVDKDAPERVKNYFYYTMGDSDLF